MRIAFTLSALLHTCYSGDVIKLSKVPCPTVYIYEDLPLIGKRPAEPSEVSIEKAFGLAIETTPGLFASNPFSVGDIIVNRLFRSDHCRMTRNPEEADLFLIPLLHSVRMMHHFSQYCASSALSERKLGAYLTHLNPSTVKKHVVFIPKGHLSVNWGASCRWLRGETQRGLQLYALSHTYAGLPFGERSWSSSRPPRLDGRVISVPYSSSFHWTREVGNRAPWTRFDDRPTRIHYIGKPHGLQAALRAKLYTDCLRLGKPLCQAETTFDHEKSLLQKRHAVFCLEPEGDSPYRKSLYDSIVMGCIPVLFSRDTDVSSPFHWGSFHAESRVLFSAGSYMRGSTTLAKLIDMPESEVRAMQASIGANAQRLQYSFDDMPGGDDAVEVLLVRSSTELDGRRVPHVGGCNSVFAVAQKKAAMRANGTKLKALMQLCGVNEAIALELDSPTIHIRIT